MPRQHLRTRLSLQRQPPPRPGQVCNGPKPLRRLTYFKERILNRIKSLKWEVVVHIFPSPTTTEKVFVHNGFEETCELGAKGFRVLHENSWLQPEFTEIIFTRIIRDGPLKVSHNLEIHPTLVHAATLIHILAVRTSLRTNKHSADLYTSGRTSIGLSIRSSRHVHCTFPEQRWQTASFPR